LRGGRDRRHPDGPRAAAEWPANRRDRRVDAGVRHPRRAVVIRFRTWVPRTERDLHQWWRRAVRGAWDPAAGVAFAARIGGTSGTGGDAPRLRLRPAADDRGNSGGVRLAIRSAGGHEVPHRSDDGYPVVSLPLSLRAWDGRREVGESGSREERWHAVLRR